MKLLTLIFVSVLGVNIQPACQAQTAVVTGTATVNGQQESANITITLLPKSTASVTFPTGTLNTIPGGTINTTIVSNTTRLQPAALQFTISGPSGIFSAIVVTTGAGATAAGKSITCAAGTPPAGTIQQVCILAGINQTTIPTGAVVANVQVTLQASAAAGNATLTLSAFTAANLFGNTMLASITVPTVTVNVSPTMAMSCLPDTASVANPVVNQVEPGEVLTCSASFSSAVTAATTVSLSSNDTVSPGMTVPASIVIASGTTSQTFAATGI